MTSPETNPAAASGQVLPAMLRYYRAQARSSSDETEIGRIARGGLTFNAPLSDARAAELLRSVRPFGHGLVADLGCGWAELLIRALEAEETATGVGVDSDADAIGRGRAAALSATPCSTWRIPSSRQRSRVMGERRPEITATFTPAAASCFNPAPSRTWKTFSASPRGP